MSFKAGQKVQKVMVQPINLIFRFLQNKSKIQVWLYENVTTRIEGHIIADRKLSATGSKYMHVKSMSNFLRTSDNEGFDEYMNLVLDEADEITLKTNDRQPLGRILLKGENITLIMSTQQAE